MTRAPEIYDRRGLIADSYRIDGIDAADCRSVFLDWALGLPAGVQPGEAAMALLAEYCPPADHPMTALLREAGEGPPGRGRRRGGAGRRRRGAG